MSRNDVILGLVALVLVVYSLVVAMVIPRRRPDFPGERLGLFTVVSVLLVVAMLGAMEFFGIEEEGDEPAAAEVEANGPAAPPPPETGTTEETGGDPAAGADIFAAQGCGSCHVLEAAGSTGTVGPNLDEAEVSFQAAVEQITNGGGGMPAYGGQITEAEIADVAAFVVESSQ